MLAEALRAIPETLRRAGRYYAVVSAHVDGCFHPKVFLRLGRDRGCLQIASANATAAGWCRNLELSAKLSWTNDCNDPEAAAKRSLIRKAYDYLLHWLEASPGQAIPAKLQIHANDADWLLDAEPNSGPVLLHDGTAVDLLLERGDGSSPGILDRHRACVDRDRINRIVIVSPYWDANGEALLDIQDAFGGAPVIVGLNPGSGTFPGALDVSQRPITFATDKTLRVERFAHAKLFLLEGENADHVVFGSPNASRAALGAPGISARNAEAAVYRRLPPRSVRHALKLTLDDIVKRLAIPPAPVSSFREGSRTGQAIGVARRLGGSRPRCHIPSRVLGLVFPLTAATWGLPAAWEREQEVSFRGKVEQVASSALVLTKNLPHWTIRARGGRPQVVAIMDDDRQGFAAVRQDEVDDEGQWLFAWELD
jgi:hypothetical protein